MTLSIVKDVSIRLFALFVSSALGIITGTGVLDALTDDVSVPIWFQALQAGAAAVALVIYDLARSLSDGRLTEAEVDDAFGIERSGDED